MTLIISKTKDLIPIYSLYRMALKLVYEPEDMSLKEMEAMSQSINQYKTIIRQSMESDTMSAVEEEIENVLSNIELLIREDAAGHFNERKRLFKEHNIDYKKFHRLPEAYTPQDFIDGQKALEQSMKDHPEEYT